MSRASSRRCEEAGVNGMLVRFLTSATPDRVIPRVNRRQTSGCEHYNTTQHTNRQKLENQTRNRAAPQV